MASSNSLSSRLEELRSRNPQSPPTESNYSGYSTPTRYSGSFMPSHSQTSSDIRASLQRRFTTDSNNAPVMAPIGQAPAPVMESVDMAATTLYKVQALERKRMEFEKLREQRRRFEAELEKFNRQTALEEKELHQMAQDLQSLNLVSAHQSEPTTPPELREQPFPSMYARQNRYSTSSLVSPPGLTNRLSRSGSQLTSPPTDFLAPVASPGETDKMPSKSVPGSRRGSNDRLSSYIAEAPIVGQRAPQNNRYSMPASSSVNRKRESVPDYSSVMGLGHINTTSFLFGDDDEKPLGHQEAVTSPDVKSYLQMSSTDDKFPILIRNNHHPGLLSASSAALDLALSQSPVSDLQSGRWPAFPSRHRQSQPNMPQNILDSQGALMLASPTGNSQHSVDAAIESPISVRQKNRHSMEASLASYSSKGSLSLSMSNGTGATPPRPSLANVQSSYSTNDIPTVKNIAGFSNPISPSQTHAQQHFHNHNASLGRIPPNAVNKRLSLSRELSNGVEPRREDSNGASKQIASGLQASAAPFGPIMSAPNSVESPTAVAPALPSQPFAAPAYYGGYGMQLLNMGMNPMALGNALPFNNQINPYQAQTAYPYPGYAPAGRYQDSQARVIQQRRVQNAEDVARFTNAKIENYQGDIYALCKDQHGCRYLQKQLETRDPETVHLIFLETNQHVVELMTDPFGNYLCQKLLEYSNDEQRTVLINNAAPQMVKIALNQHGTRALQKMIEFISTAEQIQTIIQALKDQVVELIQDLNGNHVIQKCLNRLSPEDAQFIFDAVGQHCVTVGTHRHGCCVLQRCIDHASGGQKAHLISQITQNAFSLVQDPFGNYVLQYIVDLSEPAFTEPLCRSFQGSIPMLSKQKFSSNVIEKCLRGAEPRITTLMIEEMLNTNELEKMLRDSFANYVVQTALDHASAETKARLIDAIRPILPAIRSTPYGRRIQSKIDGSGRQSGPPTPNDTSAPGQLPLSRHMPPGPPIYQPQGGNLLQHSNNNIYPGHGQNMYGPTGAMDAQQFAGANGANGTGHAHQLSNGSSNFTQFGTPSNQNPVHQPVPTYGRPGQTNGFNYF